ncbi:hypothetical protein ACFE04_019102 [Oxalis oulophora]
MRKIRGFKIGKRFGRVTRWVLKKTRPVNTNYQMLTPLVTPRKQKTMSKIINWGRRLTRGAKSLCSVKSGSGYVHVYENPDPVPKGYLAVYVGQKDGDGNGNGEIHRVLVPVIYFNHPLFGELLREAEKEYGFHQEGGITIPCQFSEFERVQTRIAAADCGTKKLTWKRHH